MATGTKATNGYSACSNGETAGSQQNLRKATKLYPYIRQETNSKITYVRIFFNHILYNKIMISLFI